MIDYPLINIFVGGILALECSTKITAYKGSGICGVAGLPAADATAVTTGEVVVE